MVNLLSNKLFAGIDVSLKENQLHCLDDTGSDIGKSIRFANNLPGTTEMAKHLNSLVETGDFESLTIGMEATALYWFPLFHTLSATQFDTDTQVLSLNPKIVSKFREAYPDMDKSDPKDSFVIADRLRFDRLPQSQVVNPDLLALQRITRFRYHLSQMSSQLKNYASSFIFLTFSEWNRVEPFSDLFGSTSKKLLKKFTSAVELAQVPTDDLKELLAEFSKGHLGTEKTSLVNQAANDSFPIPNPLAQQVHLLVKQTLQQLDLLEKHMATLDKKITKLIENFHNPLISVRGIGPVLAAGLIAEIGDISRFSGQAQLAKYAGLTWRKSQSGNFTGDITPLTKTGNAFLRYYLILAAQSMINHNPEYREYYNRKFKETPRHPHKRALTLTARKLVRLVYALLSKNQLYLTQQERQTRQSTKEEVSISQVPVLKAESSISANKKVKALTVASRPKRTLPRQQEHVRGRAVNT